MILALVLAASVAVAAHAMQTPMIPCNDIVGQPNSGTDNGYRVVLGVISVSPAYLGYVVTTRTPAWPYLVKAPLAIRASRTPITVTVPTAWRKRAAITWGQSGIVSALRIAACPTPPNIWNGYAGGFYLRVPAACVPLIFQVGKDSTTVRFGLGRACN